MGTNFYKLNGDHIGKRSAAGNYCWDCKITLNKYGVDWIHSDHPETKRQLLIEGYDHSFQMSFGKMAESIVRSGQLQWLDICPRCGQKPKNEKIEDSSAGRELGFNDNPYKLRTGVSSCSSFTWGIHPFELRNIRAVKDEYDKKYTIAEFKQVLAECPIQFFDSIGVIFS